MDNFSFFGYRHYKVPKREGFSFFGAWVQEVTLNFFLNSFVNKPESLAVISPGFQFSGIKW